MVTPDKVIEKINAIQNAALALIGITIAEEMHEGSKGDDFTTPYTICFEMPGESVQTKSEGSPVDVEIDLPLLIFSSQQKTPGKNLAECYKIAKEILKLVPGNYQLKNTDDVDELVIIQVRKQPLEVIAKREDQAILKINFYYLMDFDQ